ncbi:hypothetical protein IRR91_004016 [Salmonella enterica]|uniref:Aminopeptidase sgcX n=5 Tax=Salmonella enterica TaxID=28901 RepID=A0A379SMF4_SALER|nr:hypothetical protein [Salmonella enterica subsp. houtenae serovar 48:g,z51:-]EAV5161076.1 hypothetical protein [Salmonella enterica]EBP3474269.1 hypothetical protein [Salmonella enterica subsp. enterica]EBP3771317.1 hypothetical protein [Salmonella enterica subsp. arizonae]ECP3269151.1 hypothetical protein [Salmonella enterica subsp. enterica serovar [1],13,23:g,z51:-]EDB7324552.1 hypothetical protein [Salmonella enterica subsp. arizonae serovar 48:z4,z24:-]EDR3674168.1 hypothetical protei
MIFSAQETLFSLLRLNGISGHESSIADVCSARLNDKPKTSGGIAQATSSPVLAATNLTLFA